MLYEIMAHIRNFFPAEGHEGAYVIENNTISLSFAKAGQYILIEGSTMNDGVYKLPVDDLNDEEFTGRITLLTPPKAFIELVEEIKAYMQENKPTPYQSESFGGYSYTKATNASGNAASWQDVFRGRLNTWRKL